MRTITLITSIALLCACSTPRGTEQRRQITLDAVKQGDFVTAAATIDKIYGGNKGEAPSKEKHKLLWYMQQGQIAAMQDDFINTELILSRAGELVDERRGINVGGAVGSAVANETLRAYAGEAYEHIYIDIVRSLNYLRQGQILEGVHRPPVNVTQDLDGSMRGPLVVDAKLPADKHYQRARGLTKRLNLDQAQETADAAGKRRYDKDPFGQMLGGAIVMAMPSPSNNDRQYADAMFYRMMESYPEEMQDYSKDTNFEFELKGVPSFAHTLQVRNGLRYNAKKYKADERLDWKKDHGSILVIQKHGFIARPKTLDIRFVSAVGSKPQNGRHFHVGGVAFYANGPNTDVVNTWADILLPGDVVDNLFGSGLAIMGFALPVHEKDAPIYEPGTVSVSSSNGEINVQSQTEVVSDIDAYARATLKDEQPALFVKTFARAAAKQVAAHIAAQEVAQEDPVGGFFARLVGSSVATATEVADTRSCWLMPNYISATLIDLPAGDYNIQLNHGGGTVNLGSVTVKPYRLIILPARTWVPNQL